MIEDQIKSMAIQEAQKAARDEVKRILGILTQAVSKLDAPTVQPPWIHTPASEAEPSLSVKEAADALHLKPASVYNAIERGRIASTKDAAGQMRINRAALASYRPRKHR